MQDVSIIIVSWNVCDILRGCLLSVYEQTRGIEYEVIVIDNASKDDTVAMVQREFPQVKMIANAKNRGFAAANNQGMQIATGRYVLLLNPDTVVLDGAIQKTVAYADEHKDIGVLGCQVWVNNLEIQKTCFLFPTIREIVIKMLSLDRGCPRCRLFNWVNYSEWDRMTEREVEVVAGMYMLVRRAAIDVVGVMDEAYFVYAEETDWCYRFWKLGWRCVFTPTARIIHLDGGSKSTDLIKVKMYVQIQKSLLIFHRKHRGWLSWFLAKFLYMVSMSIRGGIFLVISFVRGDVSSHQKASQSIAALKFHIFGMEPK